MVFAGTLLPAGALGDRYGRKGALLVGLCLFGVAALLAGMSDEAWQVIAARGLMGVGAGFVMPATLSVITTVFPPAERGKAIAVWAGFAGAGGALGPVTSGLVLKLWDWSAVFFITPPIVALCLLLVVWHVPTSRDPSHTSLDPVGALLSILGLFALLFGTIEGPEKGWTSALVLGAYGAAFVLLAAFVRWELRTPHPMLDPRLFSVRAFRNGSATITVIFFVTFGMFFLIAQYLQYAKDYSPLVAGTAMLPSGITMILVAPRGPAIAARIGSELSIAIGLLGSAAGFGILSLIRPDTPYVLVGAALVLMAAGSALAMPPSTSAIVGSLPPAKAGVGSAVNDLTREVGGALGIAVLGSIVAALYRSDIASTADSLPEPVGDHVEESVGGAMRLAGGDPELAAAVVEPARDAFVSATNVGFLVAAGLMLVGSLSYFRMHRACQRKTRQAQPVPTAVDTAAAVPGCR
jgi:EmrB/QacA subfamily drug resistance transporter